jgi:hypothetical protein
MNIVWQLKPEERLKEWRNFRQEISTESIEDTLHSVIDWWKYTPIANRVLDVYNSDMWPDPWELLYDGHFDENAISLGIAYTLHLIDKPCEILFVQNHKKSFLGLIVLVDEKFILNYNYDKIDNADVLKDCEILERWNTEYFVK